MFDHLLLKDGDALIPLDLNHARGAGQNAFAASDASLRVDVRDAAFAFDVASGGYHRDRRRGTAVETEVSSIAYLCIDFWRDVRMLAQLPLATGTAHPQVLQGPAES